MRWKTEEPKYCSSYILSKRRGRGTKLLRTPSSDLWRTWPCPIWEGVGGLSRRRLGIMTVLFHWRYWMTRSVECIRPMVSYSTWFKAEKPFLRFSQSILAGPSMMVHFCGKWRTASRFAPFSGSNLCCSKEPKVSTDFSPPFIGPLFIRKNDQYLCGFIILKRTHISPNRQNSTLRSFKWTYAETRIWSSHQGPTLDVGRIISCNAYLLLSDMLISQNAGFGIICRPRKCLIWFAPWRNQYPTSEHLLETFFTISNSLCDSTSLNKPSIYQTWGSKNCFQECVQNTCILWWMVFSVVLFCDLRSIDFGFDVPIW